MSKRVEVQDGNVVINPITGVVQIYNADSLVAQTDTAANGGLFVDQGSGLSPVITSSTLSPGLPSDGTVNDSTLRWDTTGSQWTENLNLTVSSEGAVSIANVQSLSFSGSVPGGTPTTDPNLANVKYLWSFENTTDGIGGASVSDIGGLTLNVTSAGTASAGFSTTAARGSSRAFYATDPTGGGNVGRATASNPNFVMGTSDWTIEYDLYVDNSHNGGIGRYNLAIWDGGTDRSFYIELSCNTTLTAWQIGMGYSTNGTDIVGASNTAFTSPGFAQWLPVAVVRNGANLLFYVNGTQVKTQSIGAGTNINTGSADMIVFGDELGRGMDGAQTWRMDNIRFTENVARYTGASYTPETTPFDGSLSVGNLTIGDATHTDVRVAGGTPFRIISSDGTEYVDFTHDGTDLNVAGTSTTDVNFTGITNVTVAGSNVITEATLPAAGIVNTDIVTATPPTTEAVTGAFEIYDSDDTDLLASMGFSASNELILKNHFHTATQAVSIRMEDSSGTERTPFAITNPGLNNILIQNSSINFTVGSNSNLIIDTNTAELRYQGDRRIRPRPHGIEVSGDLTNAPSAGTTQDTYIDLANDIGQELARIGFDNTSAMDFYNLNQGANIRILATDSTAGIRTIINADPDSATELRGDTDLNLTSAAGLNTLQLNSDGRLRHESTFSLAELSASLADQAGRGQLWVLDDAPNTLMFTDDNGNDFIASSMHETSYIYDSTTTAADPGAGGVRFNSITIGSITTMYIDDLDGIGKDAGWLLSNLADGDVLTIRSVDNDAHYLVASVNGTPTDNTGWWTVPLTLIHTGTSVAANGVSVRISVEWLSQASSGATTLGGLTDVDLTGAANNDMLYRSGGNWVDTAGAVTFNGTDFILANSAKLDLGSTTGDRIKVFGTSYTIGIEANTMYFNSNSTFDWYFGGAGGAADMTLTSAQLSLPSQNLSMPVGRIEQTGAGQYILGEQFRTGTVSGTAGYYIYGVDQYGMYGADQNDVSHGGRPLGDTNSDWNIYFSQVGGTNRGFVFKTNGIGNAASGMTFSIKPNDLLSRVPLKMLEASAAVSDTAAMGQIWVRDDAPNTLMFTDDTGQDIKISPYRATVGTSNATQTEIISIPVPSGTTFGYRINVVGNEAATGDTVFESIFGAIHNQGGTTAIVGSDIVDRTEDAGASAWVITVAADDTTDALTVDVTGEAAHNIDWKVSVEILDV